MKRKEVEDLLKDVDESQRKAVVDSIMNLHQTDVEENKKIVDAKDVEIGEKQTKIMELTDTVKKFDGVDVEKLKNDVETWETKYNTDLAKKDEEFAMKELFSQKTFSSNSAKTGAMAKFNELGLKFDKESKTFLGANDFFKTLETEDPGSFKNAEQAPPIDVNLGGNHSKNPETKDLSLDAAIAEHYEQGGQ